MQKKLFDKYDKKRIQSLPQALFQGQIVVVSNEQEAEDAVNVLLRHRLLGFDTETRPTFKKGEWRHVALMQVSTHDVCYLFRLNKIGVPPCVVRLLENTEVTIVGLSVHDDIHCLHKRIQFTPGQFVDIQNMVGEIGIKDMSLQKLYANIFGQKITKREQLTNWERDTLTDKQMVYAATDAWACIMLYEEVMRLKETKDFELIETEEDEKDTAEKR